MRATRIIPILLCGLVATFAGTGCSTDVAGPPGVDEPFSIYGIINPRLNMQTLLVSPVETELNPISSTIDATVTSTNLHTGVVHEWKDSVVTTETGQLDHIFWAEFNPEFGGAYKVEAVRSDGASTSAVARIPKRVQVAAQADPDHNLTIVISGEAFRLNLIEVVYKLRFTRRRDPNPCIFRGDPITHVVSYTGKESPVDDGYQFDVNLGLDHFNMELLYVRNPGLHGLALMGMSIELLVADLAWDPPGGEFDANILSNPDVMTNTTNGFGLVAGGYNDRRAAYPSEEVIAATKFFDFMIRPPSNCFDYCSCR